MNDLDAVIADAIADALAHGHLFREEDILAALSTRSPDVIAAHGERMARNEFLAAIRTALVSPAYADRVKEVYTKERGIQWQGCDAAGGPEA